MSYYNQHQPPVGVPPPQGYPPEGYPKDAYPPPGYPPQGYPPPQQGYPPQYAPQYAQPPPQQQKQSTGFMEGCRWQVNRIAWLLYAVAACWMPASDEKWLSVELQFDPIIFTVDHLLFVVTRQLLFIISNLEPLALFHQRWRFAFIFDSSSSSSAPFHRHSSAPLHSHSLTPRHCQISSFNDSLEPSALFHQRWRLAFIFGNSSSLSSAPAHLRQVRRSLLLSMLSSLISDFLLQRQPRAFILVSSEVELAFIFDSSSSSSSAPAHLRKLRFVVKYVDHLSFQCFHLSLTSEFHISFPISSFNDKQEPSALFHPRWRLAFIFSNNSSSSSAPAHLPRQLQLIFVSLEPLALFHQRWRLAFIFDRSSSLLSGPTHLRQVLIMVVVVAYSPYS
ncbi:hypothetical protein Pint_33665 [Pistacia integerrima]|uniref:Uncharacterized protein n=1 Tax=Pistacia integerrima TaxID=434235 RepID=A0ACC0X4L0_9ROSI|nr:hypothetical protein Pint_33665 [Pistacia integerrima]